MPAQSEPTWMHQPSVHQGPCTLPCSSRCVPIWIQEAKILNPEVSLRMGICQHHLMSLDLVSQSVKGGNCMID